MRRLSNVEGGVYDLALESVFNNESRGKRPHIFEESRETPGMMKVAPRPYNNEAQAAWELWGENCYWLQSVETVKIPGGIHGFIVTRTTSFRCGLIITGTQVHPGYHGKITVACFNTAVTPVLVGPGARLFSIKFITSTCDADMYKGIWGGDKTTTCGVERAF